MVKQIKLKDFTKLKEFSRDIYRYNLLTGFNFMLGDKPKDYDGISLKQAWEILGYKLGQEIEGDSVIQFLRLAEALQMELESTNG